MAQRREVRQLLVSDVLSFTMTGPEAVREIVLVEDGMIPQPIAGPRPAGEMVVGAVLPSMTERSIVKTVVPGIILLPSHVLRLIVV